MANRFYADTAQGYDPSDLRDLGVETLEEARAVVVAAYTRPWVEPRKRDRRPVEVLEVCAVHSVDLAPEWARIDAERVLSAEQRAEKRERAEYERLREKAVARGWT